MEISGLQALLIAGALVGGGVGFGSSLTAERREGIWGSLLYALYGAIAGAWIGLIGGWLVKVFVGAVS